MAAPRAPRPTRWEQPQAEREARRARRRRLLGRALYFALLAAALASVVWRQTVGHERMEGLEALRAEIAVAEAERIELANRIQALQTRARITRVAAERLGMHVARDDEIVLLPVPAGDGSPSVPEGDSTEGRR